MIKKRTTYMVASKVVSHSYPSADSFESNFDYHVDLSLESAPLFSGTAQEFVTTSV